VLANILQRPLIGLARPIRLATRPGARIILSGLLGPDVPGVVGAYRRQGFRLLRHRVIDGWWCLLMRR
jgi:ribosomal protein L11 methyltransferase